MLVFAFGRVVARRASRSPRQKPAAAALCRDAPPAAPARYPLCRGRPRSRRRTGSLTTLDRMSVPGAPRSTDSVPKFEKLASSSVCVVAATQTRLPGGAWPSCCRADRRGCRATAARRRCRAPVVARRHHVQRVRMGLDRRGASPGRRLGGCPPSEALTTRAPSSSGVVEAGRVTVALVPVPSALSTRTAMIDTAQFTPGDSDAVVARGADRARDMGAVLVVIAGSLSARCTIAGPRLTGQKSQRRGRRRSSRCRRRRRRCPGSGRVRPDVASRSGWSYATPVSATATTTLRLPVVRSRRASRRCRRPRRPGVPGTPCTAWPVLRMPHSWPNQRSFGTALRGRCSSAARRRRAASRSSSRIALAHGLPRPGPRAAAGRGRCIALDHRRRLAAPPGDGPARGCAEHAGA